MTKKNVLLKSALMASAVVLLPVSAMAQSVEQAEIEDIVVLGSYIPDEKRSTSEIANTLDASEFARTGDGDIAVALSRVTGLSVVGGKYVYVRGLGERYSSSQLNGSQIPSPEPLRRVIPLDIFPTSLLSSVLVQKTYSPEFGLDFAGGVIDLRTKKVPDEFFLEAGVSVDYNTESTFKNGLTYNGTSSEFTTFGGSRRDIPQGFVNAIQTSSDPGDAFADLSAEQLEALGESLPNQWSLNSEENIPDQGYNITLGNSYDVGDSRLGFIAALDYGVETENKFGTRRSFVSAGNGEIAVNEDLSPDACDAVEGAGGVPGISSGCGFFLTEQTFSLNGMLSVGLELDSTSSFSFTSVMLRQSTKSGLIQKGSFAADPGTVRTFTRQDWIERQVLFNQLEGEHEFALFGDSEIFQPTLIDWRANYSRTDRDAPLRRSFIYDYNENLGADLLSARTDGNRTSYSALDDESVEFGVNITQPAYVADLPVDFKLGYTYFDKDRSSAVRTFGFDFPSGSNLELRQLSPEQIFTPERIGAGGFELVDFSDPSDAFDAGFENHQGYVGFDVQLTEKIRLAHGWRFEESEQTTLTTLRSDLVDPVTGEVTPRGDQLLVTQNGSYQLPSFTLTYEFTDNVQVRAGYSETINRPDLRELSSARFLNTETQETEEGNPNLLVTEITNYDLRFEWYFGLGESFTVGAFYKDFQNPIERTFGFAGEQPLRSFANTKGAELYGIEVEIDKKLDIQEWFGMDWIGDQIFFIKANGSWIKSSVDLDPTDPNQARLTSQSRALQGQSKWLGNLQFGYDDENDGQSLAIALNYTGSRIFDAGVLGAPDIIEKAPLMLKAVFKQEFNTFGVPLKLTIEADNLLDDDLRREQAGQLFRQYDIGRTFSVGLSYSFQ